MLTPWKFLSASHNKIMDRLIHTVFAHLLIFYLILFILENLFTGFVSNNFDLNIKKICEEVAKAGDVVTTSGEVTTPGSEGATPETGKKGVSSKVWIIIGIIALVVIIGAGVAVKRKS